MKTFLAGVAAGAATVVLAAWVGLNMPDQPPAQPRVVHVDGGREWNT